MELLIKVVLYSLSVIVFFNILKWSFNRIVKIVDVSANVLRAVNVYENIS